MIARIWPCLPILIAGCAMTDGLRKEATPQAQKVTTTVPAAENQSVSAAILKPVIERRETITSTGYAVIPVQNHKSPPQQRLLAIRAAKIDAYRGLLEQVYGVYLDATTTVSDMTVMSDRFRARVEGVIYGAVLTNINPVSSDTYEVTLTLDGSVVNDLRLLYLEHLSARKR